MKIHCIFGDDLQNGLHSIRYPKQSLNAFDFFIKKLDDPIYIRKYCKINWQYFDNEIFGNTTQAAAVTELMAEVRLLNKTLKQIEISKDFSKLGKLFKPLGIKDEKAYELKKEKLKLTEQYPTGKIRLYAIRISSSSFIITGGAIKVTKYMDQHEDTKEQLSNLSRVRDWLKANQVITSDNLIDYYATE